MGMNTTDIRDTTHSQSLFWAVAVPVTTSVLVIALTYGYRGEELLDWARSNFGRRSRYPAVKGMGAGSITQRREVGHGITATTTWQSQASVIPENERRETWGSQAL